MGYDFYSEHKDMRQWWPLSKDFAESAIYLSRKWTTSEIPDTPDEFQDFLYSRLLDTMIREIVPKALLEKYLDFFGRIICNPATAIFIDLMRGTESVFFIPWLQDATQANAFAMEPAYAYGRDFTKHYRKMPEYDPAIAMKDDAGFCYTRWRDEFASRLMYETGATGKILSIACGALPELRYFNYAREYLESQCIVCYDVAEINFEMFFGEQGLPYEAIHPYRMDLAGALAEELRHAAQRQYDLIVIKGYLSYALPSLPKIIQTVVQLLQKPGAKFAFDLQLENWTLQRNNFLFLWASQINTKFQLLKNWHEAKSIIGDIITDYDLPVKMEIAMPQSSTNNHDDAAGVFVVLTRQ